MVWGPLCPWSPWILAWRGPLILFFENHFLSFIMEWNINYETISNGPINKKIYSEMPKQSQNEMNKYCSCHYEYIYKCPDFCDGSGNELWPLPQSVSYNLKYVRLDTHLLKFYTQAVWLGRLDNCIKLRKLASNWLKLTI